ncbi:hypothetical protein L3Y34_019711 [Caenorhabditis briggsae]|uniref:BTB domain-containing protein n=1 Tax=Caenorhabditis briggsae TaxID=6238 RepID=A0AAE9DNQ4_CAEBR|nr:hypothetical protein L3Y34_019711 [Caenorhabditis briggsae]
MTNEVISYKSDPKIIDMKSHVLDSSTSNSLKCIWSGFVMKKRGPISFSWTFDLQEWKSAGYSGFTGYILVKPVLNDQKAFPTIQIGCDLSKSVQMVTRTLKTDGEKRKSVGVMFEYYLLPIVNPELEIVFPKAPEFVEVGPATPEVSSSNEVSEEVASYGDLFLPSERNDTILVVGAKLLYVNKKYLSYYSDYFEALFTSSEDNEKNLNLPYSIDDVEYDDFELLIRAIYPDIKFPDYKCYPKLLELAERFKMPSTKTTEKNAVDVYTGVLDVSETKGIKCTWTGSIIKECNVVCLSWDFDWDELKNKGIGSLVGEIIIRSEEFQESQIHVDIDLKETPQRIDTVVEPNPTFGGACHVDFEYILVPIIHVTQVDDEFAASEATDGVLLEVNLEDFKLLLHTINPMNAFPNDGNIEKLLELADRAGGQI